MTPLLWALLLCGAAAGEDEAPRYDIQAVLDRDDRRIEGIIRFAYCNPGDEPERSFYLFTYPNHYARLDENLTDEIFDRVYPYSVDLGEMVVEEVLVGERSAALVFPFRQDLPPRTLLRVDLPDPLPPGEAVAVEVRYHLRIPRRFGSFGEFDGHFCLNGGWHPYLPARGSRGEWRLRDRPPRSSFQVRLQVRGGGQVVLGGRHFEDVDLIEATHEGAYLTLVSAPVMYVHRHRCEKESITYYRIQDEPEDAREFLDTIHLAMAFLPDRSREGPMGEIAIVETHLRRDLVLPGDGVTLLSDRFGEVVFLATEYHYGPVVEGIYTEVFRRLLEGQETWSDRFWISEALAWVYAQAFYERLRAGPRTVKGFFTPFAFFPSIDRLLNAPRFPFVRAFFGGFYETDPLREDITRFNTDTPTGRILTEKLRDLLGEEALLEVARATYLGMGTFRGEAEARAGENLRWFFEQWRSPHPRVNYVLLDWEQTPLEDGTYRQEIQVRREGAPVRQPVEIQVKRFLGDAHRTTWKGDTDEETLTVPTDGRIWSVRIDPRHRLQETTRRDNQAPPDVKVLFDRIRFRVDLNGRDHEAEVGSTFIFNNDYRRKFHLTLFSEQEQDGVAAGVSRSFGREIDITEYEQTVGFGMALTSLDPEFATRKSGLINDEGTVTTATVSYHLSTSETRRSPHQGGSFTPWAQYADKFMGSDFRFWKAGVHGEYILPIVRDLHHLAFTAQYGASDRDGTPTQLLYDVGGWSGVRGARTGTHLGYFRWSGAAEYRFILFDHLGVNFLTLGWLRRIQLATYLEMGSAVDRNRDLFLKDELVYGGGLGFRFHVDALGVFPNVWRFDMARRLDDEDEGWLFYVGGGQSF